MSNAARQAERPIITPRPRDVFATLGVTLAAHERRDMEIQIDRLYPDTTDPHLDIRLRRTFEATCAFRLKGHARFEAFYGSPMGDAVNEAQDFAEKLLARRNDPTSRMITDFAYAQAAACRQDEAATEQAFGGARPARTQDGFGRPVRSFLTSGMSESDYNRASEMVDRADVLQRAGFTIAPTVCKRCNDTRKITREVTRGGGEDGPEYDVPVIEDCPDCGEGAR